MTASEVLLLTLRGDGPLEWGNAEVEEGEEPVDMTARFHREGADAEECEGEDDSWDEEEGGSTVLSAESVAGVWTMTVDLGGSLADDRDELVAAFMAEAPWWARRAIVRAASDGVVETLELKSPRWTPVVGAAVERWVAGRR